MTKDCTLNVVAATIFLQQFKNIMTDPLGYHTIWPINVLLLVYLNAAYPRNNNRMSSSFLSTVYRGSYLIFPSIFRCMNLFSYTFSAMCSFHSFMNEKLEIEIQIIAQWSEHTYKIDQYTIRRVQKVDGVDLTVKKNTRW